MTVEINDKRPFIKVDGVTHYVSARQAKLAHKLFRTRGEWIHAKALQAVDGGLTPRVMHAELYKLRRLLMIHDYKVMTENAKYKEGRYRLVKVTIHKPEEAVRVNEMPYRFAA